MAKDAFPMTQATWIDGRLGAGPDGRADINRHIMELYAWPLEVYLCGHSGRSLGEPQEIIDAFFADRLGRPAFIEQWRESGLPLRRWLMNGLNFYLKERRRELRRDAHADLCDEDAPSTHDDPQRAFDRAFAQNIVSRALEHGEARCAERGLNDHWAIFLAHYYEEKPYDEIAPRFDVDARRAAVMARTAARVFRAVLREQLDRDGAHASDVDCAIQNLLAEISS